MKLIVSLICFKIKKELIELRDKIDDSLLNIIKEKIKKGAKAVNIDDIPKFFKTLKTRYKKTRN